MNHISTNEIQGPPFPCPECASKGDRTNFDSRTKLGTHRMIHGVSGTSTGSKAYKMTKMAHKTPNVTRTYTKRTSTKRKTYTKANPIVAFLNNPASFASNLDTLIYDKQAEVEKLQSQIQELNKNIAFLERFRLVASEPTVQTFQEVA